MIQEKTLKLSESILKSYKEEAEKWKRWHQELKDFYDSILDWKEDSDGNLILYVKRQPREALNFSNERN